jgi:hypothetical protein
VNDFERTFGATLDALYPLPLQKPDWASVLRRSRDSGWRPGAAGARRFSLRRTMAPIVVLIGVGTIALLQPWRSQPSFLESALAALGPGRYVHAEFQTELASMRFVDLASGRTKPVVRHILWVYDSKRKQLRARIVDGGVVRAVEVVPPDLGITEFADGFRSALRTGRAQVVAHETVRGTPTEVLRFSAMVEVGEPPLVEDVFVSRRTHLPVEVRYHQAGATSNPVSFRVDYIEGISRRPRLPAVSPVSPTSTEVVRSSSIALTQVSRALGAQAVWLGRKFDMLRLTSVKQQVFARNSRGIQLRYAGPTATMTVEEARRPAAAYGFSTATEGSFGPIPQGRSALLVCDCGVARSYPAPPNTWQAQLRTDGLFITIRSSNRESAIAAAMGLRTMSTG